MSESEVTLSDGSVLSIHVEPVEVTSLGSRPNPAWTFTDAAGHVHAFSKATRGYPTLTWIQDEEDYVLMDDGYPEEYLGSGHYECRHCGEHVQPGETGPSPFREFIAGPTTYFLDGRPISESTFSDLMAQQFASRQGSRPRPRTTPAPPVEGGATDG